MPVEFHKIWVEQCAATRAIQEQHGTYSALSYLVGEKFMQFVAAAEDLPEFAQELPGFVSEIHRLFTAAEIAAYLDHFEHMKTSPPAAGGELGMECQSMDADVASQDNADDDAEDEDAASLAESPILIAQEILRFGRVRSLLQAEQ